ncbi:unnamed protein product [Camellia sinensis]
MKLTTTKTNSKTRHVSPRMSLNQQQPPNPNLLTTLTRLLWGQSLPPQLLISTVRSTWSAAWHLMMSQLAPSDPTGRILHLYVGLPCPWAHQTLIVRALKGLEDAVPVSVASPGLDGSWEFRHRDIPDGDRVVPSLDNANGRKTLREVYRLRRGGYDGRSTVPMFWDVERKEVVCNESYDIIELFNSGLNQLAKNPDLDLSQPSLKKKIEDWNRIIYPNVTNGVYSQQAYDSVVNELFSTLDMVDDHLGSFRFDLVYNVLFKCTKRKLIEYPNLHAYMRDIYQIPKVAVTCNFRAIMDGYYKILFPLNPSSIRPVMPSGCEHEFLSQPHNRASLSSVDENVQALICKAALEGFWWWSILYPFRTNVYSSSYDYNREYQLGLETTILVKNYTEAMGLLFNVYTIQAWLRVSTGLLEISLFDLPYKDYWPLYSVAGGVGTVIGCAWFLLLGSRANQMMKFAVHILTTYLAVISVLCFWGEQFFWGVAFAVGAALQFLYIISIMDRLPFTMWVLQGAVKMVWGLPEVMRVACTFMLVMLLWLALWSFGAAGVVASSMGDGGRWLLLVNKFSNTVHVIVSGMVFLVLLHGGREAASMPSKPLMKSLRYAMTTFGSICYGSLFTAAIWTLRLIEFFRIRGFRSKIGNNECLLCCVDFLFYLVETLVRFFNKYAYVQVESSVSAPTDGQNSRGLTMAQAPSDMVWHLSHFHTKLALGKATEALPLPAFSNWA